MKVFSVLPLFLGISLARADVLTLNAENFETATAGKNVFIKFFAPWCGHCKAMAPTWKQLAADYENSPTTLIAQVDCTEEENLCVEHNVEGYPTLLWGDASDLSDYTGQRDYETLKEFAEENLTEGICSPANLELCSQEDKDAIAALEKKSAEELEKLMEEYETAVEEADALFQAEVGRLEEMYEAAANALSEKLETLKKEKNYKNVKAVLAMKNIAEQKVEL